jgi:hypothetical protein
MAGFADTRSAADNSTTLTPMARHRCRSACSVAASRFAKSMACLAERRHFHYAAATNQSVRLSSDT